MVNIFCMGYGSSDLPNKNKKLAILSKLKRFSEVLWV
jgi:hypothetical protein